MPDAAKQLEALPDEQQALFMIFVTEAIALADPDNVLHELMRNAATHDELRQLKSIERIREREPYRAACLHCALLGEMISRCYIDVLEQGLPLSSR